MHSAVPDDAKTIEVNRYSDNHYETAPHRNAKVTSLRDIIPSFANSKADNPILKRKNNDPEAFNAEIYTRNFGIPSSKQRGAKESLDYTEGN